MSYKRFMKAFGIMTKNMDTGDLFIRTVVWNIRDFGITGKDRDMASFLKGTVNFSTRASGLKAK